MQFNLVRTRGINQHNSIYAYMEMEKMKLFLSYYASNLQSLANELYQKIVEEYPSFVTGNNYHIAVFESNMIVITNNGPQESIFIKYF